MRAAIYIRVSTDEQAIKGNSLAEQEERLRAYCKALGYEEIDLFDDDGYSAKDTNRPKLQMMLDRAKDYDLVVTTKIDRLCRNLLDLLTIVDYLEKQQCGYASVTESFDTSTPAGRMVMQILGAFAEFERERIRERVRDNMRSLARNTDKVISRPCFGYDVVDGKFVINELEAKVVRDIARWMIAGEGARRVMKRLNAMGIRTKEGNSFTSEAVRKLMRRETLAGIFVYNRTYTHKGKELTRPEEEWIVVDNHHEAILDKDTFDQLQIAMDSRSVAGKQADNDRWLLSGLIYCNHCGSRMNGRHRKKPSGREYFHYVCSSYLKKAECFHHFIDRDSIEDAVKRVIFDADKSFGNASEQIESDTTHDTDELISLQDRLKKLDSKMQRQIELYEDDDISKEDFRIARDRIETERKFLRDEIEKRTSKDIASARKKFLTKIDSMQDEINSDNRSVMKNAIRQLVHKVTVSNATDIDVQYRLNP